MLTLREYSHFLDVREAETLSDIVRDMIFLIQIVRDLIFLRLRLCLICRDLVSNRLS